MSEKSINTGRFEIPCEMIQDLLPSYIDELTSEVSNEKIRTHLDDCEECTRVYRSMTGDQEAAGSHEELQEEKAEIDFLKRTRKKSSGRIFGVVVAALLMAGVAFFGNMFLFARELNAEYLVYSMRVNGSSISVEAEAVSDMGLKEIEVTETEPGKLELRFLGVEHKGIYPASRSMEFDLGRGQICEIRCNDSVIWADGKKIDRNTDAVYKTGHLYVGDMPKNGDTASALNIYSYYRGFTADLQTGVEPYEWNWVSDRDYPAERRQVMEEDFRHYSYVLLAMIDNLGEVSWEYRIDGEKCKLTVTTQDASDFAGFFIKDARQDIARLQRLMEQTGLNHKVGLVMVDDEVEEFKAVELQVINLTDDEVYGLSAGFSRNQETLAMQTCINANETAFSRGMVTEFVFLPEDFYQGLPDGENMTVEVSVHTSLGNGGDSTEVSGRVTVPYRLGGRYAVVVTGDKESGYQMELR